MNDRRTKRYHTRGAGGRVTKNAAMGRLLLLASPSRKAGDGFRRGDSNGRVQRRMRTLPRRIPTYIFLAEMASRADVAGQSPWKPNGRSFCTVSRSDDIRLRVKNEPYRSQRHHAGWPYALVLGGEAEGAGTIRPYYSEWALVTGC